MPPRVDFRQKCRFPCTVSLIFGFSTYENPRRLKPWPPTRHFFCDGHAEKSLPATVSEWREPCGQQNTLRSQAKALITEGIPNAFTPFGARSFHIPGPIIQGSHSDKIYHLVGIFGRPVFVGKNLFGPFLDAQTVSDPLCRCDYIKKRAT